MEFAEELQRLKTIMQQEYEAKMKQAFDQVDELKQSLEETARDRQAKQERSTARQVADKDSEIEELTLLVRKLQDKLKEVKTDQE